MYLEGLSQASWKLPGGQRHGSEPFNSFLDTSSDHCLKDFVSGVDQHESRLFSSRFFTRVKDLQMQWQMGIEVTVEGTKDVVGSRPNFLSQNRLNAAASTRLFTVFCGYRLVDVLALLGGTYPLETAMERTVAPTGPLPVRNPGILSRVQLKFIFSIMRASEIGLHWSRVSSTL